MEQILLPGSGGNAFVQHNQNSLKSLVDCDVFSF